MFDTPPIFIGGAPRSGTTLVRAILDAHPAIACGPEMRLLSHACEMYEGTRRQLKGDLGRAYGLTDIALDERFTRFIEALIAPARRLGGKRRFAEKTPANVAWFTSLRRLFPASPQVHVVRDARDVVASLLDMDWIDGATGRPFDYVRDPRAAASMWVRQVSLGRAARAVDPERSFELRYEAIVGDPRGSIGALLAFLGEDWDDRVLDFHRGERVAAGEAEASAAQISRPLYASSIGRWRTRLTATEVAAVEAIAGPLMAEFGYA